MILVNGDLGFCEFLFSFVEVQFYLLFLFKCGVYDGDVAGIDWNLCRDFTGFHEVIILLLLHLLLLWILMTLVTFDFDGFILTFNFMSKLYFYFYYITCFCFYYDGVLMESDGLMAEADRV